MIFITKVKINYFLLFITVFLIFLSKIVIAFANPIDMSPVKNVKNSIYNIGNDLYLSKERINKLEDNEYFLGLECVGNYFFYDGKSPENAVVPFDYYNIRSLKSGTSFSNRFVFGITERLNYDLWANVKLDSYNYWGDPNISLYWGSSLPAGYSSFFTSGLTLGSLELKAYEPDISATFGTFYPSSFSEMVYAPRINPGVYGPDSLPEKGFRLGVNIKPLSIEVITAVDSYDFIYNHPLSLLYGLRGGYSSSYWNGGLTWLHGEKAGYYQDIYSVDGEFYLSKTFSLQPEISRSFYRSAFLKDDAGAFRVKFEKKWDKVLFWGQYIWVSPSYDPLGVHRTYEQRELLGIGRLADNRKGFDLCGLFPVKNGEISCEFLRFSQIESNYNISTKPFIDPLFPYFSNDAGNMTAFRFTYNKVLNSSFSVKSEFEMVTLNQENQIDFTQTTYLGELSFYPLESLSFTGGAVYLKRKGYWLENEDMTQLIPVFSIKLKIGDSFSISLEERTIIASDFLDNIQDYNFSMTTLRGNFKW